MRLRRRRRRRSSGLSDETWDAVTGALEMLSWILIWDDL